jgi:hypothetical protein
MVVCLGFKGGEHQNSLKFFFSKKSTVHDT